MKTRSYTDLKPFRNFKLDVIVIPIRFGTAGYGLIDTEFRLVRDSCCWPRISWSGPLAPSSRAASRRSHSSMSSNPRLDRESFQQLLADAFSVQESQVDRESLAAIVEVQRLSTDGRLGADGVMQMIVDRAQKVANAAGVAVGVLDRNQLVYRAGSGAASPYVGRRFAASLIVSADTQARREVLRVENADTDTRIEAAICRQFGGKSLLILPIYAERAVVGLLEVLFAEPHAFQDREIRAYRLMVGLIEDAITRDARLEHREGARTSPLTIEPAVVAQTTDRRQRLPKRTEPVRFRANRDVVYERGLAARASAKDWLRQLFLLAKMVWQETNDVSRRTPRKLVLAALATVFLLTGFIVFGSRGPASSLRSQAPRVSSASEQPMSFQPAKPTSAVKTFQGPSAAVRLKRARPSWTANKRVRAGKNEVDYFGDDVTVRYFTNRPGPQPRSLGKQRVVYIGDDVTVRDFTAN
jgi:hypothetical protein